MFLPTRPFWGVRSHENKCGVCVRKLLIRQPTLIRNLPTPLVCVGDLNGDFQTLARLLRKHGLFSATKYLSLGTLWTGVTMLLCS